MLTWSPHSTYVHRIFLTYSCTFLKSNYYLINHKKNNLHRVRKNLWISIYVRVYSGIRYVVQLKLLVWPEGLQATEESAGSLLLGSILKRASYKTIMYALRLVPCTSYGTPCTVVLGMHGIHCKHCLLILPLASNNNLTLLRCGYICVCWDASSHT